MAIKNTFFQVNTTKPQWNFKQSLHEQ